MGLIGKILKRVPKKEKWNEEEAMELRKLEQEAYRKINRDIRKIRRERREKVSLDSNFIYMEPAMIGKNSIKS